MAFHIKLKNVLTIKIYKTFIEHIHNSFNNIAKTEVSLYVDTPTVDEKLISDYWQYFLSTYAQIPPGINGEVLQQTPEINGQQIIIRVNNKPQSASLQKHLEGDFRTFRSEERRGGTESKY